jgi:hypothetical protein
MSRRVQINEAWLAAKLFAPRATTSSDAISPVRRVEAPSANLQIAPIARGSEPTRLYRAATFWIFRPAYYAAAWTGGGFFG